MFLFKLTTIGRRSFAYNVPFSLQGALNKLSCYWLLFRSSSKIFCLLDASISTDKFYDSKLYSHFSLLLVLLVLDKYHLMAWCNYGNAIFKLWKCKCHVWPSKQIHKSCVHKKFDYSCCIQFNCYTLRISNL